MHAEILADMLNHTSPKHYRRVMAVADYLYWYRDEKKSLVIVMADGNVVCRDNLWTVQR